MRILQNISLKKQLILVYVIISVLPILLLSYYLINNQVNSVLNNTGNAYRNSLHQIENYLNNQLYYYVDVIDTLAYNRNLVEYLQKDYTSDKDALDDYNNNIKPLINLILYKENSLVIKIFTRNDSIKISNIFTDYSNYTDNLNLKTTKKINWNGIVELNGKRYLNCYANIKDNIEYKNIAVLSLFIDEKKLFSIINNQKNEGNITYIFDNNGNTITSAGQKELKGKSAAFFKKFNNESNVNIDNTNYYFMKNIINNEKLNINNWEIVTLIPLKEFNKNIQKIWTESLLISFLCLILSTLILILISNNIIHRINLIIGQMNKVKKGNLKILLNITDKDEIGQLSMNFDLMVKELDRLMSEVLHSQLRIKDMEIQNQKVKLFALQSQINPHYLFNTLESIRMNLLIKADNETANIIKIFGESFRRIIFDDNSKLVSIRDEIDFTKKYFIIQKYRFKDKINYSINIDNELLDCSIPKLIIQPLIENAIYHGIELKDGEGQILIDIVKEQNNIHISVCDNGVGMEQSKLDEILSLDRYMNLNNYNSAIENIIIRLKLLYEDNYRFDIQSTVNAGTRVDITIPIEISNEKPALII